MRKTWILMSHNDLNTYVTWVTAKACDVRSHHRGLLILCAKGVYRSHIVLFRTDAVFHTCKLRESAPYSGQMFNHDALFLMPLCVLAERSCSRRWQMWWWKKDGRMLDMSLCALMIAGPRMRGTPRGVCKPTPRGFPVESKNWQIMWVSFGIMKV